MFGQNSLFIGILTKKYKRYIFCTKIIIYLLATVFMNMILPTPKKSLQITKLVTALPPHFFDLTKLLGHIFQSELTFEHFFCNTLSVFFIDDLISQARA